MYFLMKPIINDKILVNLIDNQISNFKHIAENFINAIGYKPLLHICNTSGVLNYPNAHFDMVRCGIGLYGFVWFSQYC